DHVDSNAVLVHRFEHGVDDDLLGRRDQRIGQSGGADLTNKFRRPRQRCDAARAEHRGHATDEPACHLVLTGRRARAAGPVNQIARGAVQRAADQSVLVGGRPPAAEPRHDRTLDLEPERLGIHEQSVHVEKDRLQDVARPVSAGATEKGAHQVLKYFASGWCTISASVDCSGASWNSSDSVTPIRSASSNRITLALSSRSGQAGYPNEYLQP